MSMLEGLHRIWRPELYHGRGRRGPFFEGWFYKAVSADGQNIFAVIPAVFIGERESDSHALVQVIDGTRRHVFSQRFAINRIRSARREPRLEIGGNLFSLDAVQLDLDTGQGRIRADLSLGPAVPWPVKWSSPGAMGWYAFAPFMQCYHAVLSMSHTVNGSLTAGRHAFDLDGGRGYLEKDWGRGFPSAYIWLQCNHFERPDISVMASVADIPWLGRSFRGFLFGMRFEGQWIRLTTYTGAVLSEVEVENERVRLTAQDTRFRLELETLRGPGVLLHGPVQGETRNIYRETLTSTVKLRLSKRRGLAFEMLYQGAGKPAGLDVNGRIGKLLAQA